RDRRLTRTARVQLQSRQVGEHIYHPDGAHAKLRNEIMRAKTNEQWYETLAWLYGGHG
ncbi:MAG: 3-hydroxybenzoate 6-monooxygenase, partial [Azospirillum sp.]|nr:3-hydroxybenzoate 6-monooxygenase [Azospirillum sp.]